MKTLARAKQLAQLQERLASLTPEHERRWGTLTPHEMLCHLADGYRCALGERAVSMATTPAPRRLVKWVA